MKTHHTLLAIGSSFLALALPVVAQAPKVVWELSKGIKAPESAYFDKQTGNIYLSQVGEGGGLGKDGDGVISVLKPDGSVVNPRWFAGLNAPKGLRSTGGVLWVADIDRLVGINIENATTQAIHEIEGAKFLNDVAVTARGSVLVSDMLASTIYALQGNKVSKVASGVELDSPNGLLVSGSTLYIAGWGRDIQDTFDTLVLGRLLALDLRTRKVTPVTKATVGNLDGVELDGKGGFLVTDWIEGAVLHISSKGAVTSVLDLPKGSADIAYLPGKKLLIVPQMLENKVTAYDLSGVIK
ncbi:MAG: SMP-30/gluconolactonase/LRE family protein [Verrucomicrobiota bacterium]|nr:SMP-30/gluconolactonase/LRE family protein [Verrucomicrobiota bacterium]